MTDDKSHNFSSRLHNLWLFIPGVALLGISGGIHESLFNNYLADVFNIGATARGVLEFPRELPGFLTALFAGLLFFLSETRIAAVCALAVGAGMVGLGLCGDSFYLMLGFLLLWSTGTHLMMPLRSKIAMDLARPEARGRRLGQMRAVGTGATIVGAALVWLLIRLFPKEYTLPLVLGGVVAMFAGLCFFMMRMPGAHLRRKRFVFRWRYKLYYLLAVLFGARKQVFITFGPWVLVQVFEQDAGVIAQLWIVAGVLGMLIHPLLGRAIDRFGERRALMLDSLMIIVVCIGYATAEGLGWWWGLLLVKACFVTDLLLFGMNMARETYLSKIARRPEDVGPTLSMGVTINHAVSMVVPTLGGLLWVAAGYTWVFFAAGVVGLLMLVASSRIRVPGEN